MNSLKNHLSLIIPLVALLFALERMIMKTRLEKTMQSF